MKKLFIIFFLILISCADKQTESVPVPLQVEQTEQQTGETIQEPIAEKPALIIPHIDEPDTDVYITVIATGFGTSEREAIIDGRREATIAASEIAIEKGDAYISDFSLIFENMPTREAELVKSVTMIAAKDNTVEIAASVNYTKLIDIINALNAVSYVVPTDVVSTSVRNDEVKKARILNEFAELFGNLNDVMAVKIDSIDYNLAQAQDGMIPFVVSFALYADPVKYQQKAQRMIDIITTELGSKLFTTIPVSYMPADQDDMGYYTANMENRLNERMYAIVVTRNGKDMVEIYQLDEHYRRFMNESYTTGLQIGDPLDIQLHLQLKDADGNDIYEDFMKPLGLRNSGKQNASQMQPYPALYLVNKHENTDISGRFRIGSYDVSVYSAIQLSMSDNLFHQGLVENSFDDYPYRNAIIAPYILVNIDSSYSTKEIRLQYEGLISVSDVKLLKSVEMGTIKS